MPESVTVTPTVEVPVVVGVPIIVQLAARASPAGSDPLVTAHVYGAVPPLAPIVPV